MNKPEHIWKHYVLALLLIALFITAVFFLSSYSSMESKEHGKIINISGKQRMLSQRISWMAHEIWHSQEIEYGTVIQERIDLYLKTIQQFETAHQSLIVGNPELQISDLASTVAYDIYFGSPHNLDENVKAFIQAARTLIDQIENSETKHESFKYVQNAANSSLLNSLDAVVQSLEIHDQNAAKKLQSMEWLFYCAALLLLLLEAIFIFWPSHKTIKRAVEEKIILEETKKSLTRANTELEEFAYRTSHDLRAPLVSSYSLLDLVLRFIRSDETEKAIHGIETAQNSISKLENLVEDILVLTRTKSVEENHEHISPTDIIIEATDKVAHLDYQQSIKIIRDFRFNGSLLTQRDRFLLIVENMISNAIKYQDPKKDMPFIKIVTYDVNDLFVLEVIDNGLGIPEDQQHKLFKMFSRFHPRVSFGSGLGLYMMKKSADLLNGDINFEDPGEGSIFRLTLPIKKEL